MLFHIGRSVQGTNVPLIVRCGHFTSVFDTTLNQTVMTSTTASGGNIDYSNDGKLKTAGQYWAPYAYFLLEKWQWRAKEWWMHGANVNLDAALSLVSKSVQRLSCCFPLPTLD